MLLTESEIEALWTGTHVPTQGEISRAVERAVIEKLCAGVSMPLTVPLGYDSNDDLIEGFTADQLRAYGAACRVKALEDAAMLATPVLPRPCDCGVCDCGNSGDYARVVDWDSSSSLAKAIRALKGEA